MIRSKINAQDEKPGLFYPIKWFIYVGWLLGIFPMHFSNKFKTFRYRPCSLSTLFAILRTGIFFFILLCPFWAPIKKYEANGKEALHLVLCAKNTNNSSLNQGQYHQASTSDYVRQLMQFISAISMKYILNYLQLSAKYWDTLGFLLCHFMSYNLSLFMTRIEESSFFSACKGLHMYKV